MRQKLNEDPGQVSSEVSVVVVAVNEQSKQEQNKMSNTDNRRSFSNSTNNSTRTSVSDPQVSANKEQDSRAEEQAVSQKQVVELAGVEVEPLGSVQQKRNRSSVTSSPSSVSARKHRKSVERQRVKMQQQVRIQQPQQQQQQRTQEQQQHEQRVPPINGGDNICAGCLKPIKERYLLMALDKQWHEDCLKCACCDCRLGEVGSSLFTHSDKILCRRDFLRIFGQHGHCAACKKSIPPYELVMRANENAYHMDCFACQQCQYRFCVGDRFHLTDSHRIICLLCHAEVQQAHTTHTSQHQLPNYQHQQQHQHNLNQQLIEEQTIEQQNNCLVVDLHQQQSEQLSMTATPNQQQQQQEETTSSSLKQQACAM